jgi:hypothetical protein
MVFLLWRPTVRQEVGWYTKANKFKQQKINSEKTRI